MSRTVQDILDEARGHLNDTETPYRYSNSDLLKYYNDGATELRRLRPDAFITTWNEEVDGAVEVDHIPFSETFYTAIVYFVTANAELRDDEFTNDGRVAGLLKQFAAKLMTPGMA